MKIRWPIQLFNSPTKRKITFLVPEDMGTALDQLGKVLGKDQSETIRWSLEEVLKEAIEQGKIKSPIKPEPYNESENEKQAG